MTVVGRNAASTAIAEFLVVDDLTDAFSTTSWTAHYRLGSVRAASKIGVKRSCHAVCSRKGKRRGSFIAFARDVSMRNTQFEWGKLWTM